MVFNCRLNDVLFTKDCICNEYHFLPRICMGPDRDLDLHLSWHGDVDPVAPAILVKVRQQPRGIQWALCTLAYLLCHLLHWFRIRPRSQEWPRLFLHRYKLDHDLRTPLFFRDQTHCGPYIEVQIVSQEEQRHQQSQQDLARISIQEYYRASYYF